MISLNGFDKLWYKDRELQRSSQLARVPVVWNQG
jgi:hypothetical protein